MSRFFDLFQLGALAVFLALFLGRSLQLRLVHGVNPIRLAAGKPPLQAVLELSLGILLPLWIWEVIAHAWPLDLHVFRGPFAAQLFDVPWLKGLGAVLIVAGLAIFAAALSAFGSSWRVGIDRESPGALVRSGIFARSRNPIFLFMDLYALGTFLVTGRVVFLVFAIGVVLALHHQIRQEERFLAQQYGESYRDYCARVPRYLLW